MGQTGTIMITSFAVNITGAGFTPGETVNFDIKYFDSTGKQLVAFTGTYLVDADGADEFSIPRVGPFVYPSLKKVTAHIWHEDLEISGSV